MEARGDMTTVDSLVVIDAPLEGEWVAVTTPSHRVPSHGTDYFGQRYAFDFVRMVWPRPHSVEGQGTLPHLFGRLPVERSYSWAQPVFSPFDGEVVALGNGWPDRTHLSPFKDILGTIFINRKISPLDLRPIAGNYVILKSGDTYAGLVHLRNGSLRVRKGQTVRGGEQLGEVGFCGNATEPHLHFQLMDNADPLTAHGIACAFRRYERWHGQDWQIVEDGVPGLRERIRFPQVNML